MLGCTTCTSVVVVQIVKYWWQLNRKLLSSPAPINIFKSSGTWSRHLESAVLSAEVSGSAIYCFHLQLHAIVWRQTASSDALWSLRVDIFTYLYYNTGIGPRYIFNQSPWGTKIQFCGLHPLWDICSSSMDTLAKKEAVLFFKIVYHMASLLVSLT